VAIGEILRARLLQVIEQLAVEPGAIERRDKLKQNPDEKEQAHRQLAR